MRVTNAVLLEKIEGLKEDIAQFRNVLHEQNLRLNNHSKSIVGFKAEVSMLRKIVIGTWAAISTIIGFLFLKR